MPQTRTRPVKAVACGSVCLLLVAFVGTSCGLRKPWRSYANQPFDSQRWRDGDAITRGTMFWDIFERRRLSGKSREDVVALLGEPDRKRSIEGKEVWLYQVEVIGETPRRFFPVSFDQKGLASAGAARTGTVSMLMDE